ncbi:MAG: DNA cytosine methyltransferase, partial [Solirubrobacterales bacterium]
ATRPTVVDVFSGVGGLSLGFEQAGFDVLACLEYDPIHAACHAFNFPQTAVVCADAATVSPAELDAAIRLGSERHGREDARASIDVVVGGPPCQGFSVGGRLDLADSRNRLVFAFARIVGILKPKYFAMENVPAIRHATNLLPSGGKLAEPEPGSLLNSLVREFDDLGYDICQEEILNACDFGVPQDRRRFLLMGVRRSFVEVELPSPTVRPKPKRYGSSLSGVHLRRTEGLPSGPSVRAAISDLPDVDAYEELLTADEVQIDHTNKRDLDPYAKAMRCIDRDDDDYSYARSWNSRLLTSSRRTQHSAETIKRFEGTEPGDSEPVSRFYRLDPDGLCGTLRAGTGYDRGSFSAPRPIHYAFPRVITVREAARLHSYPDWFRFHSTKWHGFRQVGNSIPPLLGRAIGAKFAKALNYEPTVPNSKISLGDPSTLSLGSQEAAKHLGVSHDAMPSHSDRTRRRKASATEDPVAAP